MPTVRGSSRGGGAAISDGERLHLPRDRLKSSAGFTRMRGIVACLAGERRFGLGAQVRELFMDLRVGLDSRNRPGAERRIFTSPRNCSRRISGSWPRGLRRRLRDAHPRVCDAYPPHDEPRDEEQWRSNARRSHATRIPFPPKFPTCSGPTQPMTTSPAVRAGVVAGVNIAPEY